VLGDTYRHGPIDGVLEAMIEAERLRIAQNEEKRRPEQDKIAALLKMAETVELEAGTGVETISMRTTHMADTAGGIARSAAAVGQNSQSVVAAATQALANAQTVAYAWPLQWLRYNTP
jgi:methyl-accepting chemotaxis protein